MGLFGSSLPFHSEMAARCPDLASSPLPHAQESFFLARADGGGSSPALDGRHLSSVRMQAVIARSCSSPFSCPKSAASAVSSLRPTLSSPGSSISIPGSVSRKQRRRHKRRRELHSPEGLHDPASRVCVCVAVRESQEPSTDQGQQKAFAGLPWLTRQPSDTEVEDSVEAAPLKTKGDILLAHYVPVYVMLPLDVVTLENKISNEDLLTCNLKALKAAGVDGVMVDVWWGIVEKDTPREYDWSAYRKLLGTVADLGLKLQLVMSFHQCGGNTGDSCFIPLPQWVLQLGEENSDIFFKNRGGEVNREYLSIGIDDECVLHGRSAVQVYADFMQSFRNNFHDLLAAGVVSEIEVGLGPAGELRYPSYPETHGWKFPGIGEFQCYDNYLLRGLKNAAIESGHHDWGNSGPHDSGRYNDWPHATGFFGHQGSFSSDYGRFFLQWYSDTLLAHGDIILEKAADAFAGYRTKLAAKVAGIHWWYNSHNHAAELAAGYYNLRERDGYQPIARMLSRHDATLIFTCAEMRNDEQQHVDAQCSPEGLVKQVLHAGWREGLEVACENALPRYDINAFNQIIQNARPEGMVWDRRPTRRISSFTFLRLGQDLLQEGNWAEFVRFVRRMHVGLDWHPEPEQYFRPRKPLRHSKPRQARQGKKPSLSQDSREQERNERDVPVASVPFDAASIPPPPSRGSPSGFFSWDAPGGGLSCSVEGSDCESDIEPCVFPPEEGEEGSQGGDFTDYGDGEAGVSVIMDVTSFLPQGQVMQVSFLPPEQAMLYRSGSSTALVVRGNRNSLPEGWRRLVTVLAVATTDALSGLWRSFFGPPQ